MEPIFFENLLIKTLFTNVDVRDKVYPFLTTDIFENFENQKLVKEFQSFRSKYEKFPTVSELKLIIEQPKIFENLTNIMSLDTTEYGEEFINSKLESFFKRKLTWNAITGVVDILKDGNIDHANDLPDKIREALSFSFDTSIGYDFAEDAERMFEYLHSVEKYIPTKITALDQVTEGGFHNKTLTLLMGASGIGKTTIMCGFATNAFLQGKKVLYVTLEMPEEKINTKILSNLMDTPTRELKRIPKQEFLKRYADITRRVKSNLIIKEYPAGSMNANRLRNLLKDLKTKKNFVPDIVFVDYIGIMAPNVASKDGNTNSKYKAISEELSGIASEFDLPIVTGVQTNRGGFSASDLSLTDVADSIGMIATAALVIGIIQTDEMKSMGYYDMVILKNRYGENCRKFSMGIDYNVMRIYNIIDNNSIQDAHDLVDEESKEIYKSNPNKKSKIDFGEN